MKTPVCPYCKVRAKLVGGSVIYPGKKIGGWYWLCPKCRAYTGTHKNSQHHAPLGTLARYELREARKQAHFWFDPLWKALIGPDGLTHPEARMCGYQWLAELLGIEISRCHIGWFDLPTCLIVIESCRELVTQGYPGVGRNSMQAPDKDSEGL